MKCSEREWEDPELKETTRSYLPALNSRTGTVCAYAPHAEHVPGASRLFLASGGKRENANYFLRIFLRIFRFPLLFPSAREKYGWLARDSGVAAHTRGLRTALCLVTVAMVIKVRIGALHLKSFSPIMARVEVSKEYVREQLHAMGVRDLSEQDLEAYTRGQGLS